MISPATRNGVTVDYTFLIAYLVGLSAFGSFVNDMYLPSLPEMTGYFHCSVPTVQLGLTMGMVGLGLGQMLLGPVSDKYGRKPVLICSTVLFMVAAIVSIFSPSIEFFLGCRFFQGLGASGGYFLARSIPTDLYAGRALAKTMAIVGAINGIAPASAPVLGGLLSQHWGWRSVFIALTVVAALLLVFSPRLKETLPVAERTKGSIWNAFKNYAVLVRNYPFMVHVLLKGSALGILFAYISSAPFIMQTHFGFREDVFGCIMGGNTLLVAAGSMVALKFKLLKESAFVGGMVLLGAVALESVALLCFDSFLLYELLLLPMLFCLGMIFTAGNTLAMNEGRNYAGDASAVLGLGGYVFGAVVSPLVGIGNIMHSTAWTFIALSLITALFALLSKLLPADLNK
ncbi:MAG: multidrug effflux MFS transporter [Muribaculaceae bacterium]|nr:multidrug effflux MFS transporter [Muribaculaceae bacterium]